MVCRVAQVVEQNETEVKAEGVSLRRRFESAHGNENLATELQGTVITKTASIIKQRFLNWMSDVNMTFSAITGETFTNAEVVYIHIGLVVFLIVLGVAGTLN